MKTDELKKPEGDGWRAIVGDDGQIRAWVRGTVPTKPPAEVKTDRVPELVTREVGGITHREVGPLVTR
jgi:hypothetical protein